MSTSASDSGSFSSSYTMILHFEEFATILNEHGFGMTDSYIDTISKAIADEVLGKIYFYGIDVDGIAHANATIELDWEAHQVVVASGDSLLLPLDDAGQPVLARIRRLAKHFMRFYTSRGLRPVVHAAYRRDRREPEDELDARYGWATVEPVMKADKRYDAAAYQSDYHPGVSIKQWYAE